MSSNHRVSWGDALSVTAQLALMLAVVHVYRLENQAFLRLMVAVVVAFPVYAFLPPRWRPQAFLLLSLGVLGVILGPTAGLALVALGVGMLGLCHLPLPWTGRCVVLALAGLGLAWLRLDETRLDGLGLGWLASLWPILGSMLMFRLLIYLHDLRYGKLQPSAVWSLNYIFLLPNVCFPLFPVVDYKRLRKSFYDRPAAEIYRRGAHWMARGLVHLLLYRVVYHHFVLDSAEVHGAVQLMQYMLAAFLLYLRVSGHFHLIIGMLLLFGCNLPETHHHYFLASSLSDFWRRINIYWKDFMAKLFFFPAHDRLRRLGNRKALALATAWVFFATWVLHAYQWFWLTGSGLLTWSDGLFWLILGGLVVAQVVWESRPGARRNGPRLTGSRWAQACRVGATFILLTVLWSLWTTESLALWLHLWSTAPLLAPSLALLAGSLWAVAPWLERRGQPLPKRRLKTEPRSYRHDAALLASLALLILWGRPAVQGAVAGALPDSLGGPLAHVSASLASNELNERDQAAQRQGYYEQLMAVPLDDPGLHRLYAKKPADWKRIDETTAWRSAEDLRRGELVPGTSIQFKGAPLTVNRWGMRDADYTLERIPGVGRWAVLGSSHTMGSGVGDGETFEQLVEDAWNARRYPVESLNFAVAGHSSFEDLVTLESRVLDFHPDVLLVVGHTHDVAKNVRFLAGALAEGKKMQHPVLTPHLDAVGAGSGQPRSVLEHRLGPARWDLLADIYGRIVEVAAEHEMRPVWVLLPLVGEADSPMQDRLVTTAESAGFDVLDLRHVYDGVEVDELRLAPWDDHPNALAHGMVGQALVDSLVDIGLEVPKRTR